MQFGLWFEPEMVNPDSDLFRAHPDWVLGVSGIGTINSRNQYTLDLTKTVVTDYLYDNMSQLIAEYDIDYIKWDMNRDTHFPGSQGRAVMHRQTLAVYALIAKLRTAFPKLEIESCSSGGARADYGILRHADRIWTSDNNDARHRQHIQRGASYFFPLRVTGSHVGPSKCHITGRIFSIEYRVASAFFGHMGMELDLAKETPEDLEILKQGIALHKQYRELIHGGKLFRLESTPSRVAMGVVADTETEGLFSCAQIDMDSATLPPRFRFAGINANMFYRVKLIWPGRNISISSPSIMEAADLMGDGAIFTGAALIEYGIQLPLTMPDTCLIYHLKAI
jgi:alpha-galactosidase